MLVYFEEKNKRLQQLKEETLNQLSAVQAEDSEKFIHSTKVCDSIIEEIKTLDSQSLSIMDEISGKFKKTLQEIIELREQINVLIPHIQEKLKQKAMAEKQKNYVKGRYKREHYSVPSIFLDKKI